MGFVLLSLFYMSNICVLNIVDYLISTYFDDKLHILISFIFFDWYYLFAIFSVKYLYLVSTIATSLSNNCSCIIYYNLFYKYTYCLNKLICIDIFYHFQLTSLIIILSAEYFETRFNFFQKISLEKRSSMVSFVTTW